MFNKYILLILSTIFLIGIVSSATYYVTNPVNCPSSDGTNFPGQNCAPEDICGDVSGIAQCYDTSTISPPGSSSTTTGSGGTDYSCSDTTCSGGFITNCYATTNCLTALVDRNATCYNKHAQTTATASIFNQSSCSSTCTTGYYQCDGSTTDTDGCEINTTASGCGVGTGTNVLNQCFSASYGNCTSSTKLDCDNDDGDGTETTCNSGIGNGCEITIGGACSVGTLAGTYGSTCTGSAGTCVLTPQHFITSFNAQGQSNATHPFLYGVDYTIGHLMNLSWSSSGVSGIYINSSGIHFNGTRLGAGADTDTFNTTQQMRDALNNSAGIYNLTSNVSVYWNNSIGVNMTQHRTIGGVINILESWLSTFWNAIWGTKTTDDLTQGTTNLYQNLTKINQTIDARVFNTIYTPTSFAQTSGTLNSGNVDSLGELDDNDYINLTESVSIPSFTMFINFSNIETFNNVQIHSWYTGLLDHFINVTLYDKTLGSYISIGSINQSTDFVLKNFNISTPLSYIQSGGNVSLRITFAQAGNGNHRIYLDYVVLQRKAQEPKDHGELKGLGDDDHAQYYLTDGSRGNLSVGGNNISSIKYLCNSTGSCWTLTELANVTGTDTFNTTQQMRDALNNSAGVYNFTSNVSVYWNNSIGANTTQHSFLSGIISILPSWILSIIPDNWGGNQTRIENNIIANGSQQWHDQSLNVSSNVLHNQLNLTTTLFLQFNQYICFGNTTHTCWSNITSNQTHLVERG